MQVTPKSYTVKVSDEIAENLNKLLSETNANPSTFKDLFLLLVNKALEPKTVVNQQLPEGITTAIENYRELNPSLPEDADVNTIITTALTQPITKEVEVIKEVNKQLQPNQYIIELSDNQMTTLKEIAQNRKAYSDKYRKGLELEEPLTLLKKMVFNKATLNNWHGEFYTGRG